MTRRRLFIPGPTEVHPDVLAAMATPPTGHRMPEFVELYERLQPKLQKLLETTGPVYLATSSATGVMEAAIRNCVRPGRRVLCCVNGEFSSRWAEIAESCGRAVDRVKVELGKPITPEVIAPQLDKADYDALTVVHSETSTGVLSPLGDIAKFVKTRSGALLLVDAVSSMAMTRIPVDDWQLDWILAGVQKGFAVPPGLTVFSANEAAHRRAAEVPDRGVYGDLLQFRKYHEKWQSPTTPAISLIHALDARMDRILAPGLEAHYARYRVMAERVRAWARKNFALFPEPGYEAIGLTCVSNTKGASIKKLNERLAARGAVISEGYGPLKEQTFRIAHMGEISLAEIEELLGWIDEFLPELGAGATKA